MMANNTEYLKKLQRHKRLIALARLAGHYTGWALGYVIVIAIFVALAALGWFLLTGKPIHTLGQGIGLSLLVMVSYVACELFRSRSNE